MKNFFIYIFSLTAIASVLILFVFSADKDKKSDQDYKKAFNRYYKIFNVSVPEKIDFCGEDTPLNLFYVRESLDRELTDNTYWHSSTLLLFKRAYRWFPVIEPILKEYGIPDDFKYLALIESNLTNIVSPAGAAGFWQFLKSTGKSYNLEINKDVDERYNLNKATVAACKYFNESYEIYNNWTLAAAAYNAGKDGISDALENQGVNSYYDLYLNTETSRYIYRILALKEICNRPSDFGFYLREKDLYPAIPSFEVIVDTTVTNLIDFANKMEINYKILKEFNPWLRSNKLPNSTGKKYRIKIPEQDYIEYSKLSGKIKHSHNIYKDTIMINDIH
jgi:hypothetical protein